MAARFPGCAIGAGVRHDLLAQNKMRHCPLPALLLDGAALRLEQELRLKAALETLAHAHLHFIMFASQWARML